MRLLLAAASLSLALTAANTSAWAETARDLDSHEHGHATLKIAVEGTGVEMELEVPGESIVGFEYAAKTDEEKAAVKAAQAQLGDAAAVFTLPEAAGCTIDKAETELHQDGDHNAFEAEYAYTCTDVSALTTVSTKLFALYPKIEEIEAEFATPAGQGAAELEADQPVVTFPTSS